MVKITAFITNGGLPATGLAVAPKINIRREDTQALVATEQDMTEIGDGNYRFTFAEVATLEYTFEVDADPTATGQVTLSERHLGGSFSGITIARIETDVPAILVDTDTTIPGLISALNDISTADILADTLGSGETVDVALSRLDNIDSDVAEILVDTDTTIPALIAGLNDPTVAAIADGVWDELLAGHAIVGSAGKKLSDLELGIIAAVAALNDISVADILAATLGSGETVDVALSRLDNIDGDVVSILVDTGTTIPALIATIDANVDTLLAALVESSLTASAGSTTTEVRTGATQANDFYNGAVIVVINSAGTAARIVEDFANTNGAFTVTALPFTPAASDPVHILSADQLRILTAVEKVRKVNAGAKIELNAGFTQLDVYEDDGTTIAFSFSITNAGRTMTLI